jgi:hypothetical protein
MNSLYEWLKFLHVVAVFTFIMSHGTSIAISFSVKKEEDVNKIKSMLDLSGSMWVMMMLSLLVAGIAGIVLGFMGNWWSRWWLWVSIVLLLVIIIWMFMIGQGTYHLLRKALGMPYMARGKDMPAEKPTSDKERASLIAKTRPHLMLLVGYGGFVVIIWLMMFKPF